MSGICVCGVVCVSPKVKLVVWLWRVSNRKWNAYPLWSVGASMDGKVTMIAVTALRPVPNVISFQVVDMMQARAAEEGVGWKGVR